MSALYRCISSSEYQWQRQLLRNVEGLGIQNEEMQSILFNLQEKKNYGVIFYLWFRKDFKDYFCFANESLQHNIKKSLKSPEKREQMFSSET